MRLSLRDCTLPAIVITDYADVQMALRAAGAGAVEFLERPVSDQAFSAAIQEAIARDRQRRQLDASRAEFLQQLELTARECDVMDLVLTGRRR